MKKTLSVCTSMTVVLSVFMVLFFPAPGQGAVNPISPYEAASLAAPDPSVLTWVSSIAYYDGQLIYPGNDQKIYAYDIQSGNSTEILNLSADPNFGFGPSGFLVSYDNYLYFLDNGNTDNIYRIDLTAAWPPAIESFSTGASGSIFAFTQNPWTDAIWFASADFGAGDMYLYEVNAAFDTATQWASFAKPHGANAGNGPIIFTAKSTVLYGESFWGGDGYFHLMDSTTGEVTAQDYLTFPGGLAGAGYGYNNVIYASSGGGSTIYEIQGATKTQVATTDEDAQSIVFYGSYFYISEQKSSDSSGEISFHKLRDPTAVARITPVDPYRAASLAAPDPAVFTWNSSIAYYDNQLIYAEADKKIYAYDLETSSSTLVCDTSDLSDPWAAVSGFLVSNDNYLYFHENTFPTVNIYRVQLTDTWPADYQELDTGCEGSIYVLTQNPWTDGIWFASADLGSSTMYLYEVNSGFIGVTQRASFAAPHSGGSGPIIFKGATTLLYGESVWGGNGYFHLVDSTTGEVTAQDYLTFLGGLAGAGYGYNNVIYASSGGGNTIYEIQGTTKIQVATTDEDAQSIVFDGSSFYISEQKSSDSSGAISFHQLWRKRLSNVPADQMVGDSVDLNGDGIPDNEQMDVIMSVVTEGGTGSKQIGVSAAGAGVFVETVSSSHPSAVGDTTNMPESFPFGLVNFRLKVTSPDGTATAVVYLSEPAPEDAKWYKYDSIDGWVDYSAHATFSADRRSVTIELKDGDYGDLDRTVNGEILDPSGVGSSAASGGGGGGGGGGGCFIGTAVADSAFQNWKGYHLPFLFALLFGICLAARLTKSSS